MLSLRLDFAHLEMRSQVFVSDSSTPVSLLEGRGYVLFTWLRPGIW